MHPRKFLLRPHLLMLLFGKSVLSQDSRLGSPVTPKSRALHTAVILQKELMVIYGGVDGSATDPYKAPALNDLYVFNITSKLWYKPTAKNTPTKGDKFHSAANSNNSNTMYVFTGLNSGLLSLDTNSWEWTSPLTPPDPISKNMGSTMVASGNSLIVYGGVEFSDGTPDTSKVSDSVYTYELTSRKWILMPNGNKLYFHSACYAPGQSEELIFGGATTDGVLASSVIALSTSAFQFYLNRISNQVPPQLIGATLACIGSNGILMGGGGLDWKATSAMVQVIANAGGSNPEFSWSRAPIKDSGMAPGARIGHSAATLGDDIYIYGGLGANDINVYKLSTVTWEWEVLTSPNSPGNPSNPNNPASNTGSKNTQIIIIAIVSALFGVLMMGVIIAVCLRHWRQKTRTHKKDAPSAMAVGSLYRGPETRAWADSTHNTPARYSSYSATNSHLAVCPTPVLPTPTLRPEEEECWNVDETTSYSVLSGQDDAASSVAPVRYLRPLSPLSSQRPHINESISSSFSPRGYPHQSEEGFAALQSASDVVSPLDRIARLHAAVEEQDAPTHSASELSTPSSSIQNWPFLARDALPLSRESGVSSQLSLLSTSPPLTSPTHPGGLDPTLHKRLSLKYRITASSLVMPRGAVSVVQATEIASLAPVAILLYRNRQDWEHDCEMLQILEGPFAPRIKESFQVPSSGKTHHVLVQERLGTPLPDILRRQAQPFSDLDLRLLIKGMARVLDFCHARGIVLVDFQPTDLAFAPEASSSRLMLARVESCHVEGDKFHRDAPPRYCAPELAAAFLDGTQDSFPALPSMDLWALGCLIYELYSRKPVLGQQASETEALEHLARNSLELSDLDMIPSEASQAVKALLCARGEDRQPVVRILDLPLLSRCPSHFSLLATLPQPVPPRFQSGDLSHKSAATVVALWRQVVATSEIQVPRLMVVLPSMKAKKTWPNPETWDADTFHVHFLCEGAPGMHFTRSPALALSDPGIFFSQAGLLVAVVAQLCSLYMSPEFLGDLVASAASSLLSEGQDPDEYFNNLAQVLESYCATHSTDPAIIQAARTLQEARPTSNANNPKPDLDSWINQWTASARDALTSTRHIALQEVRLLIQGGYESPDPSLTNQLTGLVYSRQLPPLSPGAPSIPQPRWHAWLCPSHTPA